MARLPYSRKVRDWEFGSLEVFPAAGYHEFWYHIPFPGKSDGSRGLKQDDIGDDLKDVNVMSWGKTKLPQKLRRRKGDRR